jgi:2'-5' RNA ligase
MSSLTPISYCWLIPEALAVKRFGQVIRSISARFNAPAFPPHLTLIGNLRNNTTALCADARKLSDALVPFDIHPTGIQHSEQYFRCAFLSVALDGPLARARDLAGKLFGVVSSDEAYLPHVSLLYGEFGLQTRQTLCAEIAPEILAPFRVDRIQLVVGAKLPKDWRILATFRLGAAGHR